MRKIPRFIMIFVWMLILSGVITDKTATAGDRELPGIYGILQRLEEKVASLEHKLGLLEDKEAIRTLMYTYTYYMDRALYDQALDLFSDNVESCEVGGRGVYLGKEGCRTLWKDVFGPAYGGSENQLKFGWMVDHHVTKLVITVDPDGRKAQSRGHYFSMGGIFNHPEYTGMQSGIYQLEYVKEDGAWKISKFWLPLSTTGYNFTTWAETPSYSGCPSAEYPPDRPSTYYHPFPEVYVVPFHYPNPVTGEEVPQNGYLDPTRYWQGNWPSEWGRCGRQASSDGEISSGK